MVDGKIVCISISDADNGKKITCKGKTTGYNQETIVSEGQAIFEVPSPDKFTIEVIGTSTEEVDGEEVQIEVTEYSEDVIVHSGHYVETLFGLHPTTWRGVKNIVNAHLEQKYLTIGMEIDMTLLDNSHHPMVLAAINHDSRYPHQAIFVSKYCLPEPRQLNASRSAANGWSGWTLAKELNYGRFYSILPEECREVISPRTFETVQAAANAVIDVTSKIWIPRIREAHGVRVSNAYSAEDAVSSQFAWFAAATGNKIKSLGEGGATTSWTTCSIESNLCSCYVNGTGGASGNQYYMEQSNYGILPCFHIIADDTIVEP